MTQPTEARPRCRRPKDEPEGYLQWHTWAKKKDKTHYVVRCREHDLYHVWLLRIPGGRPNGEGIIQASYYGRRLNSQHNADFIGLANPVTVLALIAEVRSLRARLNAAHKDDLAERLERRATHDMATEKCREGTRADLRAAADRIRMDAARIAKYEKVVKAAQRLDGHLTDEEWGIALGPMSYDGRRPSIPEELRVQLRAALDEKEATE